MMVDERGIERWGRYSDTPFPGITQADLDGPSGFGDPELEIEAISKPPREYLPGTEPKVYGTDAIPGKALR